MNSVNVFVIPIERLLSDLVFCLRGRKIIGEFDDFVVESKQRVLYAECA